MKAPELTDKLRSGPKALKIRASIGQKDLTRRTEMASPKYFKVGTLQKVCQLLPFTNSQETNGKTAVDNLLAGSVSLDFYLQVCLVATKWLL